MMLPSSLFIDVQCGCGGHGWAAITGPAIAIIQASRVRFVSFQLTIGEYYGLASKIHHDYMYINLPRCPYIYSSPLSSLFVPDLFSYNVSLHTKLKAPSPTCGSPAVYSSQRLSSSSNSCPLSMHSAFLAPHGWPWLMNTSNN